MKYSFKDMLLAFMLERRYRMARNLTVVTVLAIITCSMILSNISYLGSTDYVLLEWVVYIVAVFGLILGNICFFVPRYLLKNRLVSYFVWVFSLILAMLFALAGLQLHLLAIGEKVAQLGGISIYLNVVSSFVSMTLLVIGSSAIMLFRYWMISNRRINELKSATLASEMELLKQQINPHFLFNMLNNVNVLIWKNPVEAKDTLSKLEALLRYQLHEKEKEKVLLSFDIHFLNDFLNLEKIRRDQFEFTITQEGNLEGVWVPTLLFIPFVENAVKHNPDSIHASYVYLFFGLHEDVLTFRCENSKPIPKIIKKEVGGIGLKNIRRRLTLLYPKRHVLEIEENEATYIVTLKLAL